MGRKGDAALLFDAATELLEHEIGRAGVGTNRRKELLEQLYGCYGALCVESSLPGNTQLPYDWSYYIRRRCVVASELKRDN